MQKCSQTVQCYLATKYQLKHRRKLRRNATGKSLNPVYSGAHWGRENSVVRGTVPAGQGCAPRAARARQAPKAASEIPSERLGRLDKCCL